MLTFRSYTDADIPAMREMWNVILEDGVAFPGTELYDDAGFAAMLAAQTAVTCMVKDGVLAGYYILHPNNIGRCSHVANASFILSKAMRGQHLGRPLVENCLQQAKACGFRGMQFNAVVASNLPALHIYQEVGFEKVGTIPGGFMLKDGNYSDMYILYRSLL